MSQKTYRMAEGLLGLSIVSYVLAALLRLDDVANILSPLIIGGIGILLLRFAGRTEQAKVPILLLSLFFLSWAVTDVLWAFFDLALQQNPEELDLFMYLYIAPNLFLAASTLGLLLSQLKMMNRIQFLLDMTVTATMSVSFIWILFYRGTDADFGVYSATYFSSFLYLVGDAIAICSLFVWFVSTRVDRIPRPVWIASAGIGMYIISDLTYVYQIYNGTYVPNTLIDILYISSFIIVAKGLLLGARQFATILEHRASGSPLPAGLRDLPRPERFSEHVDYTPSRKALYLVATPVIVGLLRGFDLYTMTFMIGIVLLHQIMSAFVQNIGHKRKLLLYEKHANEKLEERIEQRTAELREANTRLERLSRQDAVTGLNNRRYFLETLDQMLEHVPPEECVALFFMDLDRFKAVNDSYGHDVGDRLLIEVGRRLATINIPDSILARLGGDEFVLAVKGDYERDQFEPMAWQLLSLFQTPIGVNAYQFRVSLSIGITIYPLDCSERSVMLRNADIAMYQAKDSGLNQYVFFNKLLNENIHRENELELLLRKANLREEFTLHYQPQFSLQDGSLVGAEALLRWNSPDIGSVSPGEFIPIAENNGLIVALGEWVLRRTLRQACDWNRSGGQALRLGVNLSPRQLTHPGFDRTLQRVMEATGANPAWLDLEITEHSAMQSDGHYQDLFGKIAGMGTTFSIDDFGTGYSSLSYLEKYPISRLKIARELVEKITSDDSSYQIVKAIIALAEAMDIVTIAEGVETEMQRDLLTELGCDQVQGYLFSRPLPAEVFAERYLGGDPVVGNPIGRIDGSSIRNMM